MLVKDYHHNKNFLYFKKTFEPLNCIAKGKFLPTPCLYAHFVKENTQKNSKKL